MHCVCEDLGNVNCYESKECYKQKQWFKQYISECFWEYLENMKKRIVRL